MQRIQKVNISVRNSIPEEFKIVNEYPYLSAAGEDVADSLQALREKVEQDCPEANWVLGVGFSEIQGKSCVATGFPFTLQRK